MRGRLYADFDVVTIGPGEDAEAIARTLRARPDVEYAQPAYRMHTRFKPNDPLYTQLQWNFPLIDLESAWDIQMQAGSTVTVAILDTGVAYDNAMFTANIPAFFRRERATVSCAGSGSPFRMPPRRNSEASGGSSRPTISSGTRPHRSTSTGTEHTSAEPSGS